MTAHKHGRLTQALTALPCACSGEAVTHKILQPQMVSELFLVVALSMAITPFLASLGQRLGKAFEKSDMSVCPGALHRCRH